MTQKIKTGRSACRGLASLALAAALSSMVFAPAAQVAQAAMMKKNDKMMMHKCKKGDKACEKKMMKMKHN